LAVSAAVDTATHPTVRNNLVGDECGGGATDIYDCEALIIWTRHQVKVVHIVHVAHHHIHVILYHVSENRHIMDDERWRDLVTYLLEYIPIQASETLGVFLTEGPAILYVSGFQRVKDAFGRIGIPLNQCREQDTDSSIARERD